eukprot:TRINITY_DN27982_c0_g1_i1.p1 TRINITY_DN27982_c0_g1~~TRINITY_DN27982_c0_g1_i1.p1  ORF type:complete len:678 (-),score=116.39 TRINITY_DN27982_c0_g1_i1:102-2135(-)
MQHFKITTSTYVGTLNTASGTLDNVSPPLLLLVLVAIMSQRALWAARFTQAESHTRGEIGKTVEFGAGEDSDAETEAGDPICTTTEFKAANAGAVVPWCAPPAQPERTLGPSAETAARDPACAGEEAKHSNAEALVPWCAPVQPESKLRPLAATLAVDPNCAGADVKSTNTEALIQSCAYAQPNSKLPPFAETLADDTVCASAKGKLAHAEALLPPCAPAQLDGQPPLPTSRIPRTYRSLRPHMHQRGLRTLSLSVPNSAGHPSPLQVTYVEVEDEIEGFTYMMCSYCKEDRIFRQENIFLRHLESGECQAGKMELLRQRMAQPPHQVSMQAVERGPFSQNHPPEVSNHIASSNSWTGIQLQLRQRASQPSSQFATAASQLQLIEGEASPQKQPRESTNRVASSNPRTATQPLCLQLLQNTSQSSGIPGARRPLPEKLIEVGQRSGLAVRRELLSELRLLRPAQYYNLGCDAVGLLNRTLQELARMVQDAREKPEEAQVSSSPSKLAELSGAHVESGMPVARPLQGLDEAVSTASELAPFGLDACKSKFLEREQAMLRRAEQRFGKASKQGRQAIASPAAKRFKIQQTTHPIEESAEHRVEVPAAAPSTTVVNEATVRQAVHAMLSRAPNPATITRKEVREKLEQEFGCDLARFKTVIKLGCTDFVVSQVSSTLAWR